MIIPEISIEPDVQNYGIIELGINPALHINNYPYQGENSWDCNPGEIDIFSSISVYKGNIEK